MHKLKKKKNGAVNMKGTHPFIAKENSLERLCCAFLFNCTGSIQYINRGSTFNLQFWLRGWKGVMCSHHRQEDQSSSAPNQHKFHPGGCTEPTCNSILGKLTAVISENSWLD